MSQQPDNLFHEFFKKDESGKPIALFDIQVFGGKRGTPIKTAAHSRYVLPHVLKIDHEINRLLATAFKNNEEAETNLQRARELHDFSGKLASQAIYLDSADRNSWQKVKMTIETPGTFSTLGGRAGVIKDFFNAIEKEPEANTQLDDSISL
jgi:hypothetical protein